MVDGVESSISELIGRTIEHHAALRQADDTVAKLAGVIDLVQIADHGNAQLTRGIAQILQHAARGPGVQAGHGLVGQNHLRPLGQGAGNAHTLHLPARQCLGALAGLVGQTHALQALLGQRNIAAPEELQHRSQRAHLAQASGQHVLAHRQARHQVVMLEHHGHMAGQLAA